MAYDERYLANNCDVEPTRNFKPVDTNQQVDVTKRPPFYIGGSIAERPSHERNRMDITSAAEARMEIEQLKAQREHMRIALQSLIDSYWSGRHTDLWVFEVANAALAKAKG